ncbi:Ttll5 [Symbiodinium natans]|uniref:Tubulin--tyrosine ligase-like protein 5 n=1 Tax=Symbiodinium natans TaxID=878477 RepID=A0A812UGN4_9DINO|nr:Ttll5 [Symbiodinium natans]
MNEFQRVNHFPGSTELTRKDRLWVNFRDMAQTFGDAFDFVPQTFVLPGQMQEFLDCYQKKGGLWIVKPNASSRGRGIFVLRDVADLPIDEMSVVSRYVENPLLIQGLKFDLRVYVLVTSYEPLRAYIYREGLVRFASKPYSKDPKHLTDAYRHLTNYSINKGSSSFVENSEVQADNVGHKWSISALNKHLRCTGVDVELMWTRIMDAIVKSLLSVEPVIGARTKATVNYSHNCFELYGFDVLVDQDLKPWLLEVNLSPSMQADSPLDWQIKSSLLSDSFNLVGINKVSKQRLAEATRAKSKVVKVPGKPPGPPERRRRHYVSGRSVLRQQERETEEDEDCTEDWPSVPLGTLDVEELRSTANALLECTRNRNFIRLYPTRKAVDRYAIIVDSQEAMKPWPRGRKPAVEKLTASQVLASLLFGPPPSHGKVLTCRPRSRAILCPCLRQG